MQSRHWRHVVWKCIWCSSFWEERWTVCVFDQFAGHLPDRSAISELSDTALAMNGMIVSRSEAERDRGLKRALGVHDVS